MMEKNEAKEILASMRWDVDQVITNPFGERVWLKALLDENGKRQGITDCCPEDHPCEWHAGIAKQRRKGEKQ